LRVSTADAQGLIKIRGDPCWHDLTCMDYHYGRCCPLPSSASASYFSALLSLRAVRHTRDTARAQPA
jgi:hypothetical protein